MKNWLGTFGFSYIGIHLQHKKELQTYANTTTEAQ